MSAFPMKTDGLSIANAAMTALGLITQADGVQFSTYDLFDVLTIIRWESAGDPKAEDLEDINAKEGHPSQGLMQCIPSTFQAFALPGYSSDITDPVSNIAACVRYALKTYGSLQNVPGCAKLAAATKGVYVGY